MNRTWRPFGANTDINSRACQPNLNLGISIFEAAPPVDKSVERSKLRVRRLKGATRTVVLSTRTIHEHGPLFTQYLELRKSIFLDQLKWNVSESDGMEFDQYDTPFARWVIIRDQDQILGSVRMLPTTARCGVYSYMLRDAQLGILSDIPQDVLYFNAPVEHSVWEATRFFINKSVPAANRLSIQAELFRSMSQTAMANGAGHVLGIVPAVWQRWARRLGVRAKPIGAPFSIDGTASQSVLFRAQDFID